MKRGRIGLAGAAALVLLARPGVAGAVGLEGRAAADTRLGVGLGQGWDQVGGHGRDAYPFTENFVHAEARLWNWLYLGAAGSSRSDHADYNFALERWRRGSLGLAAQALIGYDGSWFHFSAGSWLYGSKRNLAPLRPALLPYGVLRLRVGSLDGWHFNLRLLDGAPFTAEGGGTGLRLQLGAPPRGRHRFTGGLYTSLGEKVAGVTFCDEFDLQRKSERRIERPSLRFGGMLGTDIGHPLRLELTAFIGVTW